MASVRSIQNQYRGINAHLQSRLQAQSGWSDFHTNYISDLNRLVRAVVLPLGYSARAEDSLQIRRFGGPPQSPHADLLIVDNDALRVVRTTKYPIVGAQDLVAPLPEALGLNEEVDYYPAVAVYRVGNENRGEPVAWLELLSPSNKPGGRDWRDYQSKRESLLQAGIIFIEVDFLHEQSPTLEIVGDYRTRGSKHPPEPGAHPYRIAVIDPRPEFRSGEARVRQFDVDEPLPVMTIPLLGEDHFDFDFGAAYRKTFSEVLYGNEIDYGELPLNFDRYSEADQQRILCRMLAVLKAAQAGIDLEKNAPLAVESLSLDEAREQFEAW